ncbi:hypothetical protein ALC62_05373 [Cyphomyrmex costatus]|uniref:CD80-like immunoglobulin C2-set domain-containing protein n=1 Tax=Cyphomyrmex costatus TaxID=456900 RepID=A0A195CT29_9HYME|nr:hypothetical protein ALC62_05373 [Cyphomyrmex costatus]
MQVQIVRNIKKYKFKQLNKNNIKISYFSSNKLRKYIKVHKDPLDSLSKTNVAYKINCNDCNASYVGQTGRRLKTRITEHRNHIRRNTSSRSVITEHFLQYGHDFDWDNVYAKNGSSIKLHNVGFETSGVYSCEVTMETPIYTSVSDPVEIKVILPQMEQPTITFKKSVFTMGEILEANCTTAPAYPVPHITWLINDEEADIGSVIHLPHTSLVNTKSMYATAELKVKLTPSMLGRKLNYLNLRCQATIPAYSSQRRYADIREIAISGKFFYKILNFFRMFVPYNLFQCQLFHRQHPALEEDINTEYCYIYYCL